MIEFKISANKKLHEIIIWFKFFFFFRKGFKLNIRYNQKRVKIKNNKKKPKNIKIL